VVALWSDGAWLVALAERRRPRVAFGADFVFTAGFAGIAVGGFVVADACKAAAARGDDEIDKGGGTGFVIDFATLFAIFGGGAAGAGLDGDGTRTKAEGEKKQGGKEECKGVSHNNDAVFLNAPMCKHGRSVGEKSFFSK
jgi:hypothetical protein